MFVARCDPRFKVGVNTTTQARFLGFLLTVSFVC